MRRIRFSLLLFSFFLAGVFLASQPAFAKKGWNIFSPDKKKQAPAPDNKEAESPDKNKEGSPKGIRVQSPLPRDPAAEKRAAELISMIESRQSGLFINNKGKVQQAPDNRPYSADGSRNQNFRVSHSHEGGAISVQEIDKPRAQAVKELIEIGKPALPCLCRALVNDTYRYRRFYVLALSEIKDPRAVPALIEYMQEGRMRKSTAQSIKSINPDTASKLESEGDNMMEEAAAALSRITGEKFGKDLSKWRAWWEANKERIGPTPSLQSFTANPVETNSKTSP